MQVPYGIGIGQPWQLAQSPDGPFVTGGSCFSWLHTHTQDGIIHVEAPVARTFTVGDLFAVWGQPLSSNQVDGAQGPVYAYVDGVRYEGDPATIELRDRELIQLNVGIDSPPPQPFTWPPNY